MRHRHVVLRTDNFTCQICGTHYGEERKNELTIDHIIPRSKSGSGKIWNKQTACPTCNSKKGNEIEFDFDERITDGTVVRIASVRDRRVMVALEANDFTTVDAGFTLEELDRVMEALASARTKMIEAMEERGARAAE